MANIITQADFVGIIDISSNIRVARFNTYEAEAQRLDLMPLMSNVFYFDFQKNIGETIYQTLLNGEEYVNLSGDSVDFAGVKHVLVYFTWFRMLSKDDYFQTPTGSKIKLNNNSEPTSERTKGRLIQQAKTAAISYWEEVEKYLHVKRDEYPKYKCTGKKRAGIIISPIG